MLLLQGVYLLVAATGCPAVKVNMVGSLSLGQDVLGVLKEYVKENLQPETARRTMGAPPDVPAAVGAAHLCQDIPFCKGTYEQNINDYIVSLYRAVASVFDGTLNGQVFKLKPKKYLKTIKKILERANTRVTEENEVHEWTSIIKKISGVFLEKTVLYINDRLRVDIDEEKKEKAIRVLIQQLVITISKVEMDYQIMFCTEHSICVKKMECTKALNEVLGPMKDLEDFKIRAFIKVLRDNLPRTPMMFRLDEKIRQEFERVLNEMATSEKSPIKDILASVKKSLENRLAGKDPKGNDVLLIHMILSDMDHVYDMNKRPFEYFLNTYHDWIATGDNLEKIMKLLLSEVSARLAEHTSVFTYKLLNAIQVFLELTIGSAVMV